MYKSIHNFIDKLEAEGELVRISSFVNPILEIAEITDRISKQPNGGKAVLFENTGTKFPVITNMFGSMRRICLALGVESLDEIGELMQVIVSNMLSPKNSIWEKLCMLPELSQIAAWMPKVSSGRGMCQQVVCFNPNLGLLPILKCWPYDGGRFITLPMVHTRDIESGSRNVGMYRMQVLDSNLTAIHWHKHKTGARHFDGYKKHNQRMPVAVTIGGDPAYTYAATAPLPEGIDEYMLAGFIRNKRVELVKCITVDVEVPADVDFVIEGYVDPTEALVKEGPFGDHTGFYSLADWYPSFHVTCITHRFNAVYPATIVGVPPMEDAYIAKATERFFIEPIRLTMLPEMVDMVLPVEGVAHNISMLSINNQYKGQAYKVMNAMWGAGQMMFNKILLVFNSTMNLNNYLELARHLARCVNPQSDFFFGRGVADVLDHATNECGVGSKLFIDATNEAQFDVLIEDVNLLIETIYQQISCTKEVNTSLVAKQIPIVFVAVDRNKNQNVADELERLCMLPEFNKVLAVIAVDFGVPINDISLLVWYTVANIDPQRDIRICAVDNSQRANIAINATRKVYAIDSFSRDWPNVVAMDNDTIQRVDTMWSTLNIGTLITSPSIKFNQLMLGETAVAVFDD